MQESFFSLRGFVHTAKCLLEDSGVSANMPGSDQPASNAASRYTLNYSQIASPLGSGGRGEMRVGVCGGGLSVVTQKLSAEGRKERKRISQINEVKDKRQRV